MSWSEEYWRSIKSFDTEEKLDLYFYRPVGFVIAKGAKALRLTPDILTVTGALLGIAAAPFFYHVESRASLALAGFLLVLAGLFDSSDGQLARMGGGKGTKFGLVLDGICDNIVFGACYLGSTLALQNTWGIAIWPIAVLAGALHSLESCMLDYFNREYLYFGYGKVDSDYWNPSDQEARTEIEQAHGGDRWMLLARLSWIWQQNRLSPRSEEQRNRWRAILLGPHGQELQELYRERNRRFLPFWRMMGPNFHTLMILLFVFINRFDLYLLGIDILFLPLVLLALRARQAQLDSSLDAALNARGLR